MAKPRTSPQSTAFMDSLFASLEASGALTSARPEPVGAEPPPPSTPAAAPGAAPAASEALDSAEAQATTSVPADAIDGDADESSLALADIIAADPALSAQL
ncbi:MAG: hypothetical protein ACRC1H_07930, partial [Caldilineaceae bacterium]